MSLQIIKWYVLQHTFTYLIYWIRCNAIRGGITSNILAEELVPGDVIQLMSGDRVPADCRVLMCTGKLTSYCSYIVQYCTYCAYCTCSLHSKSLNSFYPFDNLDEVFVWASCDVMWWLALLCIEVINTPSTTLNGMANVSIWILMLASTANILRSQTKEFTWMFREEHSWKSALSKSLLSDLFTWNIANSRF